MLAVGDALLVVSSRFSANNYRSAQEVMPKTLTEKTSIKSPNTSISLPSKKVDIKVLQEN